MQELKLHINPENWPLYLKRKSDPAFFKVRDKVFRKDKYTCRFCGFQAREHQDVINLDCNYRNNKLSNMATACCFCAQCFFLEEIGHAGFGGGKLVYIPEMTQVELNAFCHVTFCAITNGTNYRDISQTIYRSLKFRSQPIEDKFGIGASTPRVFAQILLEYEGEKAQELRNELLNDFKILPSYAKFRKQLESWAASAASELEMTG